MNSSRLHKVGIFGGTLDPIHIGHLIIAEAARHKLDLEKIIFMPSGNPPHKISSDITEANKRLEMVKLAIDSNDNFVYSDFELKRDGFIYTSDTLRLLKEEQSDIEIYFIMGADSLLSIESWHEPEKIFNMCSIIVADRDLCNKKLTQKINYLKEKYNADIYYIEAPLVNVSSSYIRDCVADGTSIKYLVDDKVEAYIYENQIYKIKD